MIIATLCGMGFGTSMMLKLSVEDILKEEGLRAKIESWDLGSHKGQKADIIVAPDDMARHLKDSESKVVLIHNLTDEAEIKTKLMAAINELQA